MRQGIQTNFKQPDLRTYGCHFFVLMKYLEVIHGIEFTDEKLSGIFEAAIEAGLMDRKCNVLDAVRLLNYVIDEERYSRYIRDLKEPPEGICVIRLVKPGYTHFLLRFNGEIWDPLTPDRPAALTYTIDSYRVIN